MTAHRVVSTGNNDAVAEILDDGNAADRARLDVLRSDPAVREYDTLDEQRASLAALIPGPDDHTIGESPRWIHYPWRSSLVRVLGPVGFHRLRLDRNRNKITADEQDRLRLVSVGVIGLSVGHAVAHTLAIEGLAGTIRVADFDEMDLSNLNRVPASVFDLGVNKAVVAARRIAELDPYLRVEIMPVGVDEVTVADFLDGLDIVVEECDSFDAKVIVRHHARARRIPVIMETSDGGVIDVERYDLDGDRPLFHGLLGDIDAVTLTGLTTAEKLPLGLTLLDAARVTSRMAASAFELGRTISTWPQLGGDVALGGASCAAAVRRLALGLPLPSGRTRIDIDTDLEHPTDPLAAAAAPEAPTALSGDDGDIAGVFAALTDREAVVYAGMRAPSAANSQPWRLSVDDGGVEVTLDRHTTRTDIDHRASAVAMGALAHNMDVAASARSVGGDLTVTGTGATTAVRYRFGTSCDPQLAAEVDAMLTRGTDRRPGDGSPLASTESEDLKRAAHDRGATARILTAPAEINRCAQILAAHDRIRHLTSSLHREMVSEVRWRDSEDDPDTGLTLDTLGVPPGGLGMLELIRRPEVMAHLDDWDAGAALGAATGALVASSSAVVAICQAGSTGSDYVRGGMAAESVWIRAGALGLSVGPVTPISLYARDDDDRAALSPARADALSRLDAELRDLIGPADDESITMVLRVFRAHGAPPMSRRRAR